MASAADVANRVPITAALMLATLMNTLDSTIANVALPHMQGSLNASQDQITWVLTSYILATAIMTPLSGWLSQKIGRKPMILFSIAAFTVASMLCGIAANLPEMVLFRLIQGIAGASMMPLSQTVMLDIFPQRQIPQVMSIWSSAVILGPIIGPVLGGWITETLDWRWVFYINLPVGILAFTGVFMFMDRDTGGRERPFDVLGFSALVIFIAALQTMMDRGPTQDWFSSPEVWAELIISVIGLYVFVIQTMTAKNPFFHRDLAKDRNFVTSTFFGLFVGALLFSTTALLPSFMQNLLGYSALQAGYASMPRGVGSLIAFLSVPRLIGLVGPRSVLFMGVCLCVTALWQMAHFDLSMTATPIMISGLIQGMGVGLLFAPLNVLSYATLNPAHRVEGTIVATMARSLGSSIGISLLQATWVRDSAIAHARLADKTVIGDLSARASLPVDPSLPGGLAALNGDVTRLASMLGYNAIFAWMSVITLALIPLLMIMRAPPKQAPVLIEAHGD